MKVLVLDRDPVGRLAYVAIARSGGCVATGCAEDGPNLPAAIQEHKVDAIILGYSCGSGFASLRRLREAGVGIPVIVISAVPVDSVEALALGVSVVLPKPPHASEVRGALARLEGADWENADFGVVFQFLNRCRLSVEQDFAMKSNCGKVSA